MTRARPVAYCEATAQDICRELIEGRSLRAVCRGRGRPALGTVMRWLAERPDFRTRYGLARQAQADALFEEMLEIADDAAGDFVEKKSGTPGLAVNAENIQRSRLRIETRKWIIARLAPKKYGERPEDGAIDPAAAMAPEARRARIAELLARAAEDRGEAAR